MFRSIRTTVAAVAAMLACIATATNAEAPALQVQDAKVPDVELPSLANALMLMSRVKLSGVREGIVLEGTVFAVIEIDRFGNVEPIEFYGEPMQDPKAAAFVREITQLAKYGRLSPEWRRRHPDGRWAIFWMFQSDGCDRPTYRSPRDVTAIRACVKPVGGKLSHENASAYVELPGQPPITRWVRPRLPLVRCDQGFPQHLRQTAGIGYTANVHAYVGSGGRATPLLVEEVSSVPRIEEMTAECIRRQTWLELDADREAAPGYARLRWTWSVVDPKEARKAEAGLAP